MSGRVKVEGYAAKSPDFTFFRSRSLLLSPRRRNWLSGWPTRNEALHHKVGEKAVEEPDSALERIRDEFARFEGRMQDLYLLKRVAADLRNYRKMIELKRYD